MKPEKYWYVELFLRESRAIAVAKPAPVHREFLSELLRSVITCDLLEVTKWRMSNHEYGDLWLDEEGKLTEREIHGTVTESIISNCPVDVLRGPLVFTGGADAEGQHDYLDKTTAKALADNLNQARPIQVMDGFYFLPAA